MRERKFEFRGTAVTVPNDLVAKGQPLLVFNQDLGVEPMGLPEIEISGSFSNLIVGRLNVSEPDPNFFDLGLAVH